MTITKNTFRPGLDIAIIGMAGRFPGAPDIKAFWENLKNGIDSIAFFSDQELKKVGYRSSKLEDPNFVKAKGVLEDVEYFDASFFGYTPAEAETMDPQIRILHHYAWIALEDACYVPDTVEGLIGLYVGATNSTAWQIKTIFGSSDRDTGVLAVTQLSDKDHISTRISHKLNLRGPSFTLSTQCSTSLVAFHLACQGLLSGECDMALTGGVSVSVPVKSGYIYQEEMIYSRDGHCRPFDANATGTVFGNGVGMVVLKRIVDAIESNDRIYALVKGTAINNDGSRRAGYTAPGVEGQAEVISAALQVSEVEPENISYIETHGTGTLLGDPIEIEALKLAFNTNKKGFCPIGSVKSNVGHLDVAAGITGIIKTILALNHHLIPPSVNFQTENPNIDFDNSPFYVNKELKPWESHNSLLRAGVSSFGIGGTNAHVVLEEWPTAHRAQPMAQSQEHKASPAGQPGEDAWSQGRHRGSPPEKSREYQLILLSANTPSTLDKMTQQLAEHLKQNPHINLADAAYTLQEGRKTLNHRRMAVCAHIKDAIETLENQESAKVHTYCSTEGKRTLVFMFSGQGAQYVNMGLELYQTEPVFQNQMDHCFRILEPLLGPVKDILYPGLTANAQSGTASCSEKKKQEKINHVLYSGPIKFIFDYSMAKLLMKWGIKPHVMIGHSFGEYVAACLAGVFSLEDALNLVVLRGRLMNQTPRGAMLSVPLSREELKPYLKEFGQLSLAAVNTSSLCIVSGAPEAIDLLDKRLTAKGHESVYINFPHASHSRMMEPILREFKENVERAVLNQPQIPYISGLTGTLITHEQAVDPGYWARHMRETVRFADGINELIKTPNAIFVQVGCGRGLTLYVNQNPEKKSDQLVIDVLKNRKEEISDVLYLLNRIGELWLWGLPIDWSAFYDCRGETRQRISLPGYCFEWQRYWKYVEDFKRDRDSRSNKPGKAKRKDLEDWFYVPYWKPSPWPKSQAMNIRKSSCWLVFMDECGLGAELVKRLEQENQVVVRVNRGTEFAQLKDDRFLLDPSHDDQYEILFHQLRRLKKIPANILHLWGVTGEQPRENRLNPLDPAVVKQLQDQGFYSLINIARAIDTWEVKGKFTIGVVTTNMWDFHGEGKSAPGKATAIGPVRTIPTEYPYINCFSVDIILPAPGTPRGVKLVDRLLAEFTTVSPHQCIAFRGNYHLVETVVPVKLKQSNPGLSRLRDQGVYLIIGGLGGVGFVFSQFLARTKQAKLILVGRSAFPPREEWETYSKDKKNEKESIARKIHEIRELEAMGARVLVFRADVSNQEQMEEVVRCAEQQFGPINGVIHSAMVVDGAVIARRTREMTEQVLAPKVQGTLVLERILRTGNRKLDFFALFSSTAAFNGTIGEVGYCAANAFQDAFALYMKDKQDTFTFTISINWDAWLEVGQAVKTVQRLSELYHADFKNIIKHGILPKEGIEVFNRVTAGEYPQVAISTREFELGSTQQDTPEKEKSTSDAGSTPVKGNKKSTVSIYAKPRPNLSSPYIEPSTQLEQILAELWKKLFDYDRVGVRDDFFRLGGDSLKAITVIANIHKKVDVKIPLAEIFKYPTIREIAAFIKSKQKDKYVSIKPLEKRPYYDVSYAQNRVWVLSQIEEASVAFNMITANLLEGDLDKQAFDKSFVTLVERHESLRTIFVQVEGKVKQKILSADEVNFKIDFVDLKEYKARVWKSREKKIMAREANTPFDLSKGPLLKVILIRHQDRKYLFLFKMHHIIGDLLSNNVINREVLTLYNVYRKGEDNLLKPLRIHYKDYAAWQNRQLTGEYLEQHREYWLRQFKHPSPAPVLRLPTDKPRPEIQTYNGNLLGYAIVDPLASALRTLSDQQDATMFMTFLAALNVLMYQYTNQTDIVIGTPIAGREHADLENQIGFYLNTLALRTCFAEDDTFLTLLAKIRKVTWGAFEHQDFPFDKLVQELGEKRDVSRHPLFDVMLDMAKLTSLDPLTPLTTTKNPKSKLDLKMMPSKTGYRSCKFDLTVYIFEEKNFINMVFEYNTDLFEKSTIERMKKRFRLLLDRIVKNPHTLVADFDLEEEHQIPGIDTSARSRYTL